MNLKLLTAAIITATTLAGCTVDTGEEETTDQTEQAEQGNQAGGGSTGSTGDTGDTGTSDDGTDDAVDTTPTDFNFSSTNETIQLGQQTTFTVSPSEVAIQWSSSNEAIATVDENGNVTATGLGQAIIAGYSPDLDRTKYATVFVLEKELTELLVSGSTASAPAGTPIQLDVSARDADGAALSAEELDAITWTGDLIPSKNSDGQWEVTAPEAGNYSISARLNNLSMQMTVTYTSATYSDFQISSSTLTSLLNQQVSYIPVQATLSNGQTEYNPINTQCESSDPSILTLGDQIDSSQGFMVEGSQEGQATVSCQLDGMTDSIEISVEESYATSWSLDESDTSANICGGQVCLVNQISKNDNGTISAVVEFRGDSYRPLYNANGNTIFSYSATLRPSSTNGGASISNPLVFDKGQTSIFEIQNTDIYGGSTTVVSRFSKDLLFSNLSTYSLSVPSTAELHTEALTTLGDGYIEALIYDENGGEGSWVGAEGETYTPQYSTEIRIDGSTALLPKLTEVAGAEPNYQYTDLINTIDAANLLWGKQASSIFTLSGGNINQNFLINTPSFTSRSIDVSECGISASDIGSRIFAKQVHYPSDRTIVLCSNANDILMWNYDDSASHANSFTFHRGTVPSNWFGTSQLEGLSYMGIDAITDTLNGNGNLSVMAYFGYEGADETKTHYGVLVEDATVTPIVEQAKIGMGVGESGPYSTPSLMNKGSELVFNYVATTNSRELWTPYGNLGQLMDSGNGFQMGIGKGPFEYASAVPFTYSYEGKKTLGLLVFSSGDADAATNSTLNVYNNDLTRLP